MSCVESQCTPSDLQDAPAILDGLCSDSASSYFHVTRPFFHSLLPIPFGFLFMSFAAHHSHVVSSFVLLLTCWWQLAERLSLVSVLHRLLLRGQATWLLVRLHLIMVVLLEPLLW
jgi:hypothetical protein